MYLLYPKNPTWQWLRAIPTSRSENFHNFLMSVRPLSWACGHGNEMLLILKKIFSTWLFSDIFRYDSPDKCPTILYAINLGLSSSQQTQNIDLMLGRCWASVVDGGPTSNQHCIYVLCLLRYRCLYSAESYSSNYIWIPMLWIYCHYTYYTLSVLGSTLDVRIWLKPTPWIRRITSLASFNVINIDMLQHQGNAGKRVSCNSRVKYANQDRADRIPRNTDQHLNDTRNS